MTDTASNQRFCPTCGTRTAETRCPADGTSTIIVDTFARDALSYGTGDVVAGRYRITGALGRGGFGAVYAAEHTGTHQQIALKMITVGSDQAADSTMRRFYREAQTTGGLTSPHTVRVFDVGQAEHGPLYLAMELLRGPTLDQLLRKLDEADRALTEAQAVEIALGVLRSLAEAHKAGLVHRDLKPANIMLAQLDEEDPVVKVVDFGVAHSVDSSLTATGKTLGTPRYMSPEQCHGGAIDGRSDLYSLGVILYQCVTAVLPFDEPNPMTLMWMHAHQPVPDVRKKALGPLSDAFVACLYKALEKEPDLRFEDAKAMRTALEELRSNERGLLREPVALVPVRAPQPTEPSQPLRTDRPPPTPKSVAGGVVADPAPGGSRRGLWVGLALLGVVGLMVALFLAWPRPAAPPVAPAPVAIQPTPAAPTPPPQPKTFALLLDSTPPGADVLEEGRKLGTTPLTLTLEREAVARTPRAFVLHLDGFQPYSVVQGASPEDVHVSAVLKAEAAAAPVPEAAPPVAAPVRRAPAPKHGGNLNILDKR